MFSFITRRTAWMSGWKGNHKWQTRKVTSWTLIPPVTQTPPTLLLSKGWKAQSPVLLEPDKRLCMVAFWDCCASERRENLMEASRVKTWQRLTLMSCDCLLWNERTVIDPLSLTASLPLTHRPSHLYELLSFCSSSHSSLDFCHFVFLLKIVTVWSCRYLS